MYSGVTLLVLALVFSFSDANVCPNAVCANVPFNPEPGQVSGIAAFEYEGNGPNVPANWAKLDCKNGKYAIFGGCSYCTSNECGGKKQSPIDIKPTTNVSFAWVPEVSFDLATGANVTYTMGKGAYSLGCDKLGTCGSISIGADKYDMLQLHTHQKSEHSIEGVLYDTEVHTVHIRDGKHLLVIGQLFTIGNASVELQKYIDASTSMGSTTLNILELYGGSIDRSNLVLYEGSLTTPPCSETVRWVVHTKILTASEAQIAALFKFAGGKIDNRPVQPMNDRILVQL